MAEVLDALAAGDRQTSRTAFMIDEISKWCAAYFDDGQSVWRLPSRGLPPYAAWRASMRHDLNPEVMGIRGFRDIVADHAGRSHRGDRAVIERASACPNARSRIICTRRCCDIGGWAAYARYLVWDNALYGRADDTLVQLLAIRVVWGYALFMQRTDAAFQAAWREAMAHAAKPPQDEQLGDDPDLLHRSWCCRRPMRRPISAGCWRKLATARPAPARRSAAPGAAAGRFLHRRALGDLPPRAGNGRARRPKRSASPASSAFRSNTSRSAM